MFDFRDAKAIMGELAECRRMHGEVCIRLCGFASTHTWESLRMSLFVQRPTNEPALCWRGLSRGRNIGYETRAYEMEKPEGSRYG